MIVTANVGETIAVRFTGDCAAGGRLMINGVAPAATNDYTDVWSGQITGSWTPNRAGNRTLAAAWACVGRLPCPLRILGHIKVVTPAG